LLSNEQTVTRDAWLVFNANSISDIN